MSGSERRANGRIQRNTLREKTRRGADHVESPGGDERDQPHVNKRTAPGIGRSRNRSGDSRGGDYGRGPRLFCGYGPRKNRQRPRRDLHWPYGIPTGMPAAEVIDSWRSENRNFMRLWEFGKPIIGAINGWAMGAGSWLSLFTHVTLASENAVFAQPEVRHGSNTSFMWTLLGGFKNALRYGLTGDHIDAQEALRIGLVVKVFRADQLLDECFSIVERIAHVTPETVKINLQIATLGLQMMGLRDALLLDNQLSAPAHVMLREELRRPLDEARFNEGTRKYLQLRDGPFQPEPFGPRARKKG